MYVSCISMLTGKIGKASYVFDNNTTQEDIRTIKKELERLFRDHPSERNRLHYHLEQAYAFQSYVVDNYTAACHDYGSTTSAYVTCYLEDEAFFEWPFHYTHACHWYYYEQNNIVADEDVNRTRH